MALILYNFGLFLYRLLIRIVAPFNTKAYQWIKGRRNLWSQIAGIDAGGRKKLWIHCASLGEFEQGRPLLEKIKSTYPEIYIVLTFFSPSGYEIRKGYAGADIILYSPLDGKRRSKKFLDYVQPDIAILVKYELWYYYLKYLDQNGISSYLISANFRSSQWLFKPYAKLWRKRLKSFNALFVQRPEVKELLSIHGFANVHVAADTRFDRVWDIRNSAQKIPMIESIINNRQVLVAGSIWPEDEKMLLPVINQGDIDLLWILAPHEINPAHLQKLEQQLEVKSVRYSALNTVDKIQVLIIDNIGLLAHLYKYGNYAYVGGGFGEGIHNILEPAAQGCAIMFGPNHQKFTEAHDLLNLGAAKTINDSAEIRNAIRDFQMEGLDGVGATAEGYVRQNTGGTAVIMKHLSPILEG